MKLLDKFLSKDEKYRVETSQKIYIGLSAMSMAIISNIIGGSLLAFYTIYLGFPPLVFGFVYLLWGFWNAVNDPLVGYWSDKIEPKKEKGKRLILMRMSFPILIFSYFMLFYNQPVEIWGLLIVFVVFLLIFFLYDLGVTLFYINFNALILAITDDPQERAQINVIGSYLSMIPNGLGVAIPFYFLTGDYSIEFILTIFSVMGVVSAFIMVFSLIKIKEPIEVYDTSEETFPIIKGIKETFRSRAFRFWIIVNFTMSGIGASYGPIIVFVFRDVYEVSGFLAFFPVIIGGGSQVIFMPILLKFRKKYGSRATIFLSIILMFVGYTGFLILTKEYFIMIFFYWCILTGFSGHLICANTITGDIVDEDELRTGQRREGMFFGVNAIFTIPASGLFVLFFTIVIDIFGYDPNVIPTPEVILGIKLGFTLLPMIFLAISMIALYFFPLHGEYYEELREKVVLNYDKKIKKKEVNNYEV